MANSENLNEPKSHHLQQNVNPALFLSFTGHSIEFFLDLKDFEEKATLAELVYDGGGTYIDNEDNITEWTAIMVDNLVAFNCARPMFHKNYIKDCVEKNTLLDITNYTNLKDPDSNSSLMDIIFWRKRSFLPINSSSKTEGCNFSSSVSKHKDVVSPSKTDSMVCVSKYEPLPTQHSKRSKAFSSNRLVSKSTRQPYSRKEKEDILKFIIAKEKFSGLKGNSIWVNMEVRGICPKRTFQSLKEHFSKVIIYQLDNFDFLTEEQKAQLRQGFFHCK